MPAFANPPRRLQALVLTLFLGVGGAAGALGQEASGGRTQGSGGRVSVSGELFGRAPYPMFSRGGRVGYDWNASGGLELSYFQAKDTVLLADVRYREADLTYKQMLNGFVHWSYGVGFRRVDLDYSLFVDDAEEAFETTERHEAVTVSSRFGFEVPLFFGLGLGCDLFGVSIPVRWTRHTDNFPDEARSFEQDPKDFPVVTNAFKLNYQFARTYVVIAF